MNKTMIMKVPPSARPNPFGRRGATQMLSRVAPHPLMAATHAAASDLLALAAQLGTGAPSTSAPELRGRLDEMFSTMAARGRSTSITPEDLSDASYALMALFDEILVRASWPGRQEWQASPLQFIHFRENTAGDNFFRRAETLCEQPHRAHVLQIYFLCMALGFQGRYAMGNLGECEAFYEKLWSSLAASTLPSDILSPHGTPPDGGRTLLQREAPIVRLGIACLGAACLCFLVLRGVRSLQLARALEPMHAYASARPPSAAKP